MEASKNLLLPIWIVIQFFFLFIWQGKTFSILKLANQDVVTMTTMCTSEKASWAYTHKHNFTTNATDDVIVVYLRRERDDMEMCVCVREGCWNFMLGMMMVKKKQNPRFNNNKQKYFIVIKYLFIVLCGDEKSERWRMGSFSILF